MPHKNPEGTDSAGSGFFFSDNNLILTCAHVVENATGDIMIQIPAYGKKFFPATIRSVCMIYDVALLEMKDKSIKHRHIPFSEDEPEIADSIMVIGYPKGLSHVKYTQGIISGQQEGRYQYDSPVNFGNSGGPVIKDDRVIGIVNSAMITANNVGFCTPVKQFMGVYKPMLDKPIINMPETWGFYYHKILSGGLFVHSVQPNTPAGNSGLKPLDVITHIDGYEIDKDGDMEKMWLSAKMDPDTYLRTLGLDTDVKFTIKNKDTITIRISEPALSIQWIFYPVQKFEYIVFAGIVFLQLCVNVIHYVDLELEMDSLFVENGCTPLSAEAKIKLYEALSYRNRNRPRVVIMNTLIESDAYGVFRRGDLLKKVNDTDVFTIKDLYSQLKKSTKSIVIHTDDGKYFPVPAGNQQQVQALF